MNEKNDLRMDRIRALDYIQKTGLQVPEAKKAIQAIINLGKVGPVEIGCSGPGLETTKVRIDTHVVANAKSILRGLREIGKAGK
jgi:hypothetical protein